ncbi:5' nucleotidase, NT5C type [Aestuariirhabdus litorea]|uniref:Uncharacterized protein n=1 Tax=Aestuariirhabdus litorea TaxID=2528527 RepID=A0A3P3VJ77_9GAMM|nr:hypothetical protein [Aestuariirhabdus litorea]RRJ82801.1 hypothetical protein D0544_13190 [Aestuariirhabdus litorea]RWW92960.1 hypothetical protein DZC74_13165 [Endozoicomonadaceae bacterium GTF-13]
MACTVFIDMDDTLCDYRGAFERDSKANPEIEYPQSQFGFFESLHPIDNALPVVQWLQDDPRFEPYILTAPSIRNPWCYTGKRIWVENHLGLDFCNRLIICAHKNLLIGDYLIDDYDTGKGQELFRGELAHFGSSRFPSWDAVKSYLNQSV